VQVRGLIVQDGQASLIFMAAWRQQDWAAQADSGCHEPDLMGTPELAIRVNDGGWIICGVRARAELLV
jgi:hypothetical protein